MQNNITRLNNIDSLQDLIRQFTVPQLVDSLGLQRSVDMIQYTITDKDREWEQKRLERELENLERVPSLSARCPPSMQQAVSPTQPRPWNYDFSDVFKSTSDEQGDIEKKLCLKYKELEELKEDRDRAERGIVRCRGEISELIAKVTALQGEASKK